MQLYTLEPPNNGNLGTRFVVRYLEAVRYLVSEPYIRPLLIENFFQFP